MSDPSVKEVPSALKSYWRVYGGVGALVRSKFVWLAAVLAGLCYGLWSTKPSREILSQVVLDTVPSLLGFSIGAMAILLAFSQSKFFAVLSEDGKSDSAYLDLGSKFVHFILVQAISIIAGIFLKGYPDYILVGGISCFLLMYAILTAVAAGLALFGMAEIYNKLLGNGDS